MSRLYKREEANIAIELGYGDNVAKKIEKAKTQREREQLLCMARHEAIKQSKGWRY